MTNKKIFLMVVMSVLVFFGASSVSFAKTSDSVTAKHEQQIKDSHPHKKIKKDSAKKSHHKNKKMKKKQHSAL